MNAPYPLIAIVGPTASGKTRLGVELARHIGGEIVSGDSRQVYRGMDIGTGKDIEDYGDVPYHLIDIAPAGYKYNLYEYVRDARIAIDDIGRRGKKPIIVGGTGLYIETLLKGLVLPEVPCNTTLRSQLEGKSLEELTAILAEMKSLHNTTDVDTAKRAIRAIEIATYYHDHPDLAPVSETAQPLESIIIHIDIDREERRNRITARLKSRLQNGMVEEIRNLLDSGIPADDLMYYGLEYKFVTAYVTGRLGYKEMVDSLEIAIHQFAKRQETWFRGMRRRGFTLHSLPYDLSGDDFTNRVLNIVSANQSAAISE